MKFKSILEIKPSEVVRTFLLLLLFSLAFIYFFITQVNSEFILKFERIEFSENKFKEVFLEGFSFSRDYYGNPLVIFNDQLGVFKLKGIPEEGARFLIKFSPKIFSLTSFKLGIEINGKAINPVEIKGEGEYVIRIPSEVINKGENLIELINSSDPLIPLNIHYLKLSNVSEFSTGILSGYIVDDFIRLKQQKFSSLSFFIILFFLPIYGIFFSFILHFLLRVPINRAISLTKYTYLLNLFILSFIFSYNSITDYKIIYPLKTFFILSALLLFLNSIALFFIVGINNIYQKIRVIFTLTKNFVLLEKTRKILMKISYVLFFSLTTITLIMIVAVLFSGGFKIKCGFLTLSLRKFTNPLIEFLVSSFLLILLFRKRINRLVASIKRFAFSEERDTIPLLIFFLLFLYFWWWGYSYPVKIDGDGIGYYSYLRSVIMDGNLRFEDEFEKFESGRYGLPEPWEKTSTGYVPNPYSIGPAILWAPFFLIALLISYFINFLGGNILIDGYSQVFVLFVSAGTKIYGFLGMFFIYKSIRPFFRKSISTLSTLFIWLSTPLTYYFSFEPFMSHMHSLFCISLMFYFLLKNLEKESFRKWILLGILNGFIGLSRWQDLTFSLLPLMLLLIKSVSIPKIISNLIRNSKYILLYLLFLSLTFLPQIGVFKIIYGFWFGVPQGKEFVSFVPSHLLEVLFSPLHGLLQWHPILIFALIGLIWGSTEKLNFSLNINDIQKINIVLFTGFLLQWLFNSALWQWWGGHSFGMRRLINCSLFFAFGLAFLIRKVWQKRILKSIFLILFSLLSFINLLIIKGYIFQMVPHEEPFTYFDMIKVAFPLIKDNFFGYQINNFIAIIFFVGWFLYLKKILKN